MRVSADCPEIARVFRRDGIDILAIDRPTKYTEGAYCLLVRNTGSHSAKNDAAKSGIGLRVGRRHLRDNGNKAMATLIGTAAVVLAGIAAVLACLAFLRSGRPTSPLTRDQVSELLRAESDRIRETGDKQASSLRSELDQRIGTSHKLVADQLEKVHRGLGEMQQLADGVGELKRVLTNVKARGVFGEVQLGSLLDQMFSPEQYVANAQVNPKSQERVEFAVKIPGRSGEGIVLLPIDAKFPISDFERLIQAADRVDAGAVELAAAQMESKIRNFAKDVAAKYINPPLTTDIAILFLPIESLFAEVLRRPGVIESIQETYQVIIAGPTTLLAILNAYRMSIRAVAIQQRSTEVWQLLGAVRIEFGKHDNVVARLERQLEAALNSVTALGTRTRTMQRKLQGVDSIGTEKIENVLGLPPPPDDIDDQQGLV
jgi:DNA recombination protein RmuC